MTDRMFAALLLPDSRLRALDAIIEPRRAHDDEWRWTRPESWHITLAFYESVEPWRYDLLVNRLADAAVRTPAFPVGIEGVGTFPSDNPARAKLLYAAVDDPTGSLPPLALRCRNSATTSGIEVPGERYVPHLTLARSNRPVNAVRWLRALVATYTDQWQATELALVQSHLGEGRARYEVRERFPLAGA